MRNDSPSLNYFQGLNTLVKLEELSIENNFLKVIDGIDNLLSLSRLNVSKNDITDIEGQVISNLPRLSYLALDHNRLHSLAKLNGCSTLIELYAGNNLIKNIRDIFHLKVRLVRLFFNVRRFTMENFSHYRIYSFWIFGAIRFVMRRINIVCLLSTI